MRIGYFADGPWSHLALEKIIKDERFEIVFIVPRYDVQDPILLEWSVRLKVDYLVIKNINVTENIGKLTQYSADLFVSMSFNQIFGKDILNVTPLGVINCHAGALPYYRGRNILNWVLINDEKEFGVTVHYVDEGIDTGDIIVQNMSSITDEDNYSTLLNKAISLCAQSLFQALDLIVDNNVKRRCQDAIDSVGMYCGRRLPGDEWVDWSSTSRVIFNFIRAIAEPGPCARTLWNGHEIVIQSAKEIVGAKQYIGTVGEVIGIRNDGYVIKTGDSSILLQDIIFPDGNNKLRIGQRLDVNKIFSFQKRIVELEKLVSDATKNF